MWNKQSKKKVREKAAYKPLKKRESVSVVNDSKYDPYPNDGPSDNPDSEPNDGEEPSEPMTQSPSELPEAEITTTPHPADTSKSLEHPSLRNRPRRLRSLLRLNHKRIASGMIGRPARTRR